MPAPALLAPLLKAIAGKGALAAATKVGAGAALGGAAKKALTPKVGGLGGGGGGGGFLGVPTKGAGTFATSAAKESLFNTPFIGGTLKTGASGIGDITGGFKGIPKSVDQIFSGNVKDGLSSFAQNLGDIDQGQRKLKSLGSQARDDSQQDLFGLLGGGINAVGGNFQGKRDRKKFRAQLGAGSAANPSGGGLSPFQSRVLDRGTSAGAQMFPSFSPDRTTLLRMVDAAAQRRPGR